MVGVAALALILGSAWGSLLALRVLEGTWVPGDGPPPLGPALVGTLMGTGAAAGVAWARMGPDGLGLDRASPRWMAVGLVLLPFFLGFSWLWTTLLEALGVPLQDQEFVVLLQGGRGIWELLGGLYGVVGAPLLEEILFRGLLLSALQRRWGSWAAILGSALCFGGMHGSDPQAVPPLIALGVALGWLRVRSGTLWPGIALHAANNATALLALVVA